MSRRFEAGYVLAKAVILPWLGFWFRKHVEGAERIPRHGPAIIAVNHISLMDPFAVAYVIDRAGRRARFLAKSSLFDAPFVGWILRTARQVRVDRGTSRAVSSLEDAERAIADGEIVVIFPEGTTTTDPDLRPMEPKTGVARLALSTKAPLIPCATWGGQWVWSYYVGFKPGPGKDLWVRLGQPMSLDDFAGREDDPAAWEELSARVMEEISVLTAGMRAAKPWTPVPMRRRSARKKQKQMQKAS